MTLQEFYAAANGSYEEAKGRLSMDKLVERFILKFPKDGTMQMLLDAVKAGSIEESFRAAHTLKGVAANLAFTELAETASELTEQLRPRTSPADEKLLDKVQIAYNKTVAAIAAYSAANGK